MKFDKEFKEAIIELPTIEKDRLLLRLLKKDLALARRFYFELVSTDTVDECRTVIEHKVIETVSRASDRFYSVALLMKDLRYLSGDITEHVKTTKDKFGEVSLNLLMVIEVLRLNNTKLKFLPESNVHKLYIYIIARVFKILTLINTLHDDFYVEFETHLHTLGELISSNNYLMKTAIYNGFDVNWLLNADIPENIAAIHKEVKQQGYLK